MGELPLVPPLERVPWSVQLATVLTILVPLLGLLAVPVLVWGWGFHWLDGVLLVSLYLLMTIGITVGYHRLFTHRNFETFMGVKVILAIFGSMALEGPLFKWVAIHRRHHQYSDMPLDPHSPHHRGAGWWGCCEVSGTPTLAGFSGPTRRNGKIMSRICTKALPCVLSMEHFWCGRCSA